MEVSHGYWRIHVHRLGPDDINPRQLWGQGGPTLPPFTQNREEGQFSSSFITEIGEIRFDFLHVDTFLEKRTGDSIQMTLVSLSCCERMKLLISAAAAFFLQW